MAESIYESKMNWGSFLSERQWGTVREDYSKDGDAWNYFSFEEALTRAYRWGEDGIGGICDSEQIICFAPAFWNGKDNIIKERFFGLTNKEGNHGEDVKEYYYYLDNTPSHNYMKMLYKYPQSPFPYEQLKEENRKRTRLEREYELIDTGIFNENRYFDIFIEYAIQDNEDVFIKITSFNRGNEKSRLEIIPQVWFRNTWAWGKDPYMPVITPEGENHLIIKHKNKDIYYLYYENSPDVIFCDNETNVKVLFNSETNIRYFKDGINDYMIHNNQESINRKSGTKTGLRYITEVEPGNPVVIRLRLTKEKPDNPFDNFDEVFFKKIKEANDFYSFIQKDIQDEDERRIQRQAFAGMLWNKQFYYYDVREWLNGDPTQPAPPEERRMGRNSEWFHLNNSDIISMPDTWEYPWYATWDLGFHTIPFALIDPDYAKRQLLLLTKEWYMHPNGQLPAYEWNFSDVNPPVHAWAAWRVYKIEEKYKGKGDTIFLERILHKLLINFTWWVNKKDYDGRNIFQGGFLGMDNIGVFDRSSSQGKNERLDQADGTAWMAMYSLNMMRIALELSKEKPYYQDIATKFFEHFLYIAGAMENMGGEGDGLWDNVDQFYYDMLHSENQGTSQMIKIRSMVGLIPLFAVEVLESEELDNYAPEFNERLDWFLNYRPDLAKLVSRWSIHGKGERHLLSLLRGSRMKKLIRRLLDESEYLSDYGVRSLSKVYKDNPYIFSSDGENIKVNYTPAESDNGMFGGNSNWRGPIWMPCNFLIIESLQRFHHYYGDDFLIEYPVGSGKNITIKDAANELTRRLKNIFLRDKNGKRAVFGNNEKFQNDPNFKDYILFHEYFNGDTGEGLGASHQTGWTGLIAKLIQPRRSSD